MIRIPVDIDLSTNTIRYINKKIFEVNIDDTAIYIEQLHANFCLEYGLTQNEIMYNEYVTEQELINRNVYLYEFKNKILNELKIDQPYFLSGGISEENITQLSRINDQPFSLDINSKFEIDPGNKDLEKIKKFVDELSREATD